MEHLSTSLDTIECPHCHHSFPITSALQHLIEPLRNQLEKDAAIKEQALAERAESLRSQEADLAKATENIDKKVAARVEETTKQLKQDLLKEAHATVKIQMDDMQAQLQEKRQMIVEFQKTELDLRRKEQALEERAQAMELEVQRKLDAERKTIAAETAQRLTEEHRLKEQELEKVIRDLGNQLEDAKRTAEQGSQQTQGEVLELELEQFLRATFPHDDIQPVPKGKRGADVVHTVYTPTGHRCGTIIWESKRTKRWDDGWLGKVKDDQREAKGDVAIIITETLPKDIKMFGVKEDLWVTSYACLPGIAQALRSQVVAVALMRKAGQGKDEKMEVVFNFLTGPEFRNRVQAMIETFSTMQTDLDKERLVYERAWGQREKQIQRVLLNIAGMYGNLQELVGPSMQSIPALEAGDEASEPEETER